MDRRRYSDSTEQFEYVLTDRSRDLADIIVALTQWSDR